MNHRLTKFGKVYATLEAVIDLNSVLKVYNDRGVKVFFLVDENTHEACLPPLLQELPDLGEYEVLEVPPGEASKSIEVSYQLWGALSELGADRHSLLVNVGGGMITDLGGFIASTYKRGVPFVNVPTSLLAMVDAAVGGKTGVDVGGVKNMVGTFSSSEGVFIVPDFLYSLPDRELIAGFAEVVKHALISSPERWRAVKSCKPQDLRENQDLVRDSLSVKLDIVESDPLEKGDRKFLNFGHTLGHAIESHFLETQPDHALLHGEAVAIGMWLELELSVKNCGLDPSIKEGIQGYLTSIFPKPELAKESWEDILAWLKHDKKNESGAVRFVLLESLGKPVANVEIDKDQIIDALASWNSQHD